MNESTPDHDAWQPCPPGEIGRMVGQLNAQRRRQQLKQFGGGVAALVLFAAVVTAGRGLLTRPSPSGPIYGGIACSQVMPLMQAFHDGTLAPGLAVKVRIHIDQCPNCGPKYRQMYAHAAVARPTWREAMPEGYRLARGNAVKYSRAAFCGRSLRERAFSWSFAPRKAVFLPSEKRLFAGHAASKSLTALRTGAAPVGYPGKHRRTTAT